MNILITGGRAPSALYLTRLFAKAGHRVYVADSNKSYLTKYSNYVSKSFFIRSPRFLLEEFICDLELIIKEYHIEMLIPTCEEVFYISLAKERLGKYCRVFCDEFDKLSLLHNKFEFINYLKGVKIKYPKTILCQSEEELRNYVQKHFEVSNSKAVLKPVYSRFSARVLIVNNNKDLNKFQSTDVSKNRPWVMQEFIEGNQICCYCVCNNGKILAYSDYNTIFTAGLGGNIYFEYANNESVKYYCQKIVSDMSFTGQIAFDFIVSHDGDVYPIECNPRTTSGVHLFGYNHSLENAFLQNKDVELTNAKNWALKTVLLFKFQRLRKWINCMLNSNDVIYCKKDLKPTLMQGVILMQNIMGALLHRKKLIEITTIDIEFDGSLHNHDEGGKS